MGGLIGFCGLLKPLGRAMSAVWWVTNIFQRGAASMGRLNYILEAKPKIDDSAASIPATRTPEGEIEFRNLTFTYPTTLSGAGANGAGKSNCSGPRPVL